MKERPILFSAPMVNAILEGRKTQTRRALRIQPLDVLPMKMDRAGIEWVGLMQRTPEPKGVVFHCKFGQPGDQLWVRETWQGPLIDEELEDEFMQSPDCFKKPAFCAYRATDTLDAINADGEELGWRPSIHMPRWASRILLEITGVRVERLNGISYKDALAEGIVSVDPDCHSEKRHMAIQSYAVLWESLNGVGSWEANPWVWVVEFKQVQP